MTEPLPRFLADCLAIVLIDLLLAGDNALVIAMAVRHLPRKQRTIGVSFGAAAAVALRVAITIVAAQLLNIQFIKLAGGAFVLWIAVKVLAEAESPPPESAAPRHFLQAIWYIVFADITMSTDNVLAIAGASHGNDWLIVFGLGLSIPFIVFSSTLLAVIMDRYPITVYLGAAILGKVGAEMMLTDGFVTRTLHPSDAWLYAAEAAAALGIVIVGRALGKRARSQPLPPGAAQ
jgi:YjbE family integral membrane protein